MFPEYQINLRNTANLNCSLQGGRGEGRYSKFWEGEKALYEGNGHFMGGLEHPLRNLLETRYVILPK